MNNLPLKLALGAAQLVALIGFFAIALSHERKRKSGLPLILTPMILIAVSVLVTSIAAFTMDDSDYQEYTKLWFPQMLGFMLGFLFSNSVLSRPSTDRPLTSSQIVLSKKLMSQLSTCVFVAGCLCAIAFLAWKGIPLLSGNVEQGRVDAASSGTGYLRLMAYETIPPALLSFALSPKKGKYYVAISLMLILFLANRSPLIYLFGPLVFVSISRKIKIKRPSSLKPIIVASLCMLLVVGIGTYRIFSQFQFLLFPEYASAIQNKDVAAVALLSFEHYANVVATNAVLTKSLIDNGRMDRQYGASYFALFSPVLPGEHLTLDRQIKLASGSSFIGGGIPPTLMGEGYANFGYIGIILEGGFVALLVEYWYRIVISTYMSEDRKLAAAVSAMYGYMAVWVFASIGGGLAGAATTSLAGAITLIIIWKLCTRRRET